METSGHLTVPQQGSPAGTLAQNEQKMVIKPTLQGKYMENDHFYKVLGIDRSAQPEAIKNAYRKLALINHPDKAVDKEKAQEMMGEINRAYKVLGNPKKRHLYDKLGPEALQLYEDADEKTLYILKILLSSVCQGMTMICGLLTCGFCCGFFCCFCCCNFCCGRLIPRDIREAQNQNEQGENCPLDNPEHGNLQEANSQTFIQQEEIPR